MSVVTRDKGREREKEDGSLQLIVKFGIRRLGIDKIEHIGGDDDDGAERM